MQTFRLAYEQPWLRIMRLLGVGPKRSGIVLDGDSVRIRLGWAFQAVIPRSHIVAMRRLSDTEARAQIGSIGAHGLGGGRWAINGAFRSWVSLEIDPPVPGRCMGRGVTVRRLDVTVVDPEGVLTALRGG